MKLSEADKHWLAGLLEGEGHFGTHTSRPKHNGTTYTYYYPLVQLHMTDLDIVERARRLTGANGPYRQRRAPHKDSYNIRLTGKRARELMLYMKPLMGTRRQAAIEKALA